MKRLFLPFTLLLSSKAIAQIVVLSGCGSIDGPYYQSGTTPEGGAKYEASYYCYFCMPQSISIGTGYPAGGPRQEWQLKAPTIGSPQAYNTNITIPAPPETGWVKSQYSVCPTPPTIIIPQLVESKNCDDCNWSDPATWVGNVVPNQNSHVIVNGTVLLDVDVTCLNFTIASGKSLKSNNGKGLTIKGKYENEGVLRANTLRVESFTIAQELDGTHLEIENLVINNRAQVSLTGTLVVLKSEASTGDNVTVTFGNLVLGAYDLVCHGVQGNANGRIVTNGTGKLKYQLPAGSFTKEFPIGKVAGTLLASGNSATFSQENYVPVTISGAANGAGGQAVTIAARVGDFTPGHTIPQNTNAINAEWTISSEHQTLDQPYSVKFGWPALAPTYPNSFNVTNIYVKRWNGSDWENKTGPKWYEAYPAAGYGITVEGVTEFSSWGVFDAETVLPVKLVNFGAVVEQNDALLAWSTSEEENSNRFEIEHSLNGKNWVKVGDVLAKGTSYSLQHYTYKHPGMRAGNNYYRLRMVDHDGSYTYSRIVTLRNSELHNTYFYPNPANDRIFLNGNGSEIAEVAIVDSRGNVVSTLKQVKDEISTRSLAVGIYSWRVTYVDGRIETGKFLIGK